MPNHPSKLDPITGFLDRRACIEAVTRRLSGTTAGYRPLAVIWLNVDRFRQINESFGHVAGDEVIAQLAERIRTVATFGDPVLARMGSDEFVIAAHVSDIRAAEALGNRLLASIESPLHIEPLIVHPSASVGIAIQHMRDSATRLLERADLAMLGAKRLGGARVFVSGSDSLPDGLGVGLAREELAIEADLHLALETGGLSLVFQPVLTVDGHLEAVEALMRCEVRGHTLPTERFIPVAEKTGLIVRLGEWSLLQGTRFAAGLRNIGRPTKVAINISRAQLTSPGFLPALHGALICSDIDPALIELEITESLAMDNQQAIQDNLRLARESGVGIAIDDFGTGYSSLSILKDLPATKLKLDQSFCRNLPEDRRAFAVIGALARLGRELGMLVVAEGVENGPQLDSIIEAGVDALQGFHLARPMTESELISWLQQGEHP